MQPDVAVAADEFILITAAVRYGFVKQVVQRKLHTHMAAVRRQHHKQQQALSAVQRQSSSVRAVGGMSNKDRPAKRQRLAPAAECEAVQEEAEYAGKANSSSGSNDGDRSGSRSDDGCTLTRSRLFRQSAQRAPTAGARTSDDSSADSLIGIRAASSSRNSKSNSHGSSGSTDGSRSVQSQADSHPSDEQEATGKSAMQQGTYGVLLDCCPTLALFHPTETRHLHTWRNFAERLLVDVNSDTPGDYEMTLLEALALVRPNLALFFRKVDRLEGQEPAQLLRCVERLWQSKSLPPKL